jgi:hypothetical protein
MRRDVREWMRETVANVDQLDAWDTSMLLGMLIGRYLRVYGAEAARRDIGVALEGLSEFEKTPGGPVRPC